MTEISADLYRRFYEDDEWWSEHYAGCSIETDTEHYDENDTWALEGNVSADELGAVIDENAGEYVCDEIDAVMKWLEDQGLAPWKTITMRVELSQVDAFMKVAAPFLVEVDDE